MRSHKCYDIVPTSSKLVVFDTTLQVSVPSVYELWAYCSGGCPTRSPPSENPSRRALGPLRMSGSVPRLQVALRGVCWDRPLCADKEPQVLGFRDWSCKADATGSRTEELEPRSRHVTAPGTQCGGASLQGSHEMAAPSARPHEEFLI